MRKAGRREESISAMGSGVCERPKGVSEWKVGSRAGLDLITQQRRLVELCEQRNVSPQSGVSVYCLPADWKVTYMSMFF